MSLLRSLWVSMHRDYYNNVRPMVFKISYKSSLLYYVFAKPGTGAIIIVHRFQSNSKPRKRWHGELITNSKLLITNAMMVKFCAVGSPYQIDPKSTFNAIIFTFHFQLIGFTPYLLFFTSYAFLIMPDFQASLLLSTIYPRLHLGLNYVGLPGLKSFCTSFSNMPKRHLSP